MTLQKKIIKTLGIKHIIDFKLEIKQIIQFIKNYLKQSSMESLIIGISGGQDSTLTGKLCQISINELRHEIKNSKYKLFALRLPYGEQMDEKDCLDVIAFIKPDNIMNINIKNAVLSVEKLILKSGINVSSFVRGNIKSRERMNVQYTIANLYLGLVVGTQNAAEAVTGFFTKYGDGGTDINPISHLNKGQIKKMLQLLSCPKHLYLKNPTADLEDDKPGIPDEKVLNVKYDVIDKYLKGKIIDEHSKKIIEKLYLKTQHKRKLPINIWYKFKK